MTKDCSIASVTVAYNSAQLLPRQLDALLRQGRPLDEIIVVNNGSTDKTRDVLSSKYPQVTVVNLPDNRGVGGGFSTGLDYAVREKGHDWVWLLDDDSVPNDDALGRLLNGLDSIDGHADSVAILAPVPVHGTTQLSYPGLLWRSGWVHLSSGLAEQPISFVDAVISSGTLIHAEAIRKVGLPRADFFMDFVDFELCLRLRRHGYRIAVVRDSLLNHTIGIPKRVSIFGYSRTWADHSPWREYYMSRNQTYTIWNYYPDWKSKAAICKRLLRHAVGVIVFGEKKYACLKMMCLGFFDGRAGKLGIRFLDNALEP